MGRSLGGMGAPSWLMERSRLVFLVLGGVPRVGCGGGLGGWLIGWLRSELGNGLGFRGCFLDGRLGDLRGRFFDRVLPGGGTAGGGVVFFGAILVSRVVGWIRVRLASLMLRCLL